MRTLEHRVLRIADSDWTWMGFNWLRPEKQARVGMGWVVLSSFLLGLPGLLAGAAAVYLFLGRVELDVWRLLFVVVMATELPLHIVFARYWNRRAERLERGFSPAHD